MGTDNFFSDRHHPSDWHSVCISKMIWVFRWRLIVIVGRIVKMLFIFLHFCGENTSENDLMSIYLMHGIIFTGYAYVMKSSSDGMLLSVLFPMSFADTCFLSSSNDGRGSLLPCALHFLITVGLVLDGSWPSISEEKSHFDESVGRFMRALTMATIVRTSSYP